MHRKVRPLAHDSIGIFANPSAEDKQKMEIYNHTHHSNNIQHIHFMKETCL